MSVESRAAQGRRELVLTSLDEMLADAEKLVASPETRTVGKWPLSQLLTHLALAIDKSIDGIPFTVPWHTRLLGFFIKGRVLKNGFPAGFKLPKDVEADAFPTASSPQEALEQLRQAVARSSVERMTARHPVFGRLTHEEWTRFHLHHAALHLSFALPG